MTQELEELEQLRERVDALTTERDQLAEALESRIVIEQAKGVLAERYRLTIDDAFLLLRRSARDGRVEIHRLAREIASTCETPQAVIRRMARDSRLRAIAMRERSEATAERTQRLRARHAEQLERVNHPTARVRVTSRGDALDLAARLDGCRWYMITPDNEHWDILIELNDPDGRLLPDLQELIRDWLRECSLPMTQITIGQTLIDLFAS